MGKKLISKASSRICKNNENQKFNSLIKVLRPKVYITESSNFKKLIQELTGNNAISTDSYWKPEIKVQAPVSDFEIQESGMEVSFDASIESVVLNEEIYEDITAFDLSVNKQMMELPAVWELESWLLDMDSFDYDFPQIEQEITSFAGGHCQSSQSIQQHPNPILHSFSYTCNNL